MKPNLRVARRFVGVFAGIGGLALAQTAPETSSPPVQPPGVERPLSLTAAKKDFDSVKSLRDFGTDPRNEGARLTLPTMPSAPTPSSVLPPQSSRPLDDKPTSNWLVDAMDKSAKARSVGRNERFDFERREGNARRDVEDDTKANADEVERERRERTTAANPFARYLQGWISAQDLALLQPALEPGRGPNTATASFDPVGRGAEMSAMRGGQEIEARGGLPGFGLSPVGVGTQPKGRENPYLESLGDGGGPKPLAMIAENAAPRPPATVFPTAPTLAPIASPAPPRSRVPDFVRPTTDDKYFKPLKRF